MIRLYTAANKQNFRRESRDLELVDWGTVFGEGNNDPDLVCNHFIHEIGQKFDKNFPKVKLSNRASKDKPWITKAIKISSAHKTDCTKDGLKPNPELTK